MDEKLKDVDLIAELDGTFRDVAKQLVEDEKRWGVITVQENLQKIRKY